MIRAAFFVDGFNLYHAIDDKPNNHQYKWLNLRRLAQCFPSKSETITDIRYYTALATWAPAKVQRHSVLMAAYRDLGIQIIQGVFRKKQVFCPHGSSFWKPEEKRTDVNIAIDLLDLAYSDQYDRAYVISGDSDLAPAVIRVMKRFPSKEVIIVIPLGRRAEELVAAARGKKRKMKLKHLNSSQLDRPYVMSTGGILTCPQSWQ